MSQEHTSIGSRHKQLFLDISHIVQRDKKTGIQRVVRAILKALLSNPPIGYQIKPIYAIKKSSGFYYAHHFSARLLGEATRFNDEPIVFNSGDSYLGIDLHPGVLRKQKKSLNVMRQNGVRISFIVYDLLPILMPQHFRFYVRLRHKHWLKTLFEFDGIVCISKAVANEVENWRIINSISTKKNFFIGYFHLGADIENSIPSKGIPISANKQLGILNSRPSFLMVGTLEPRKGHHQVLQAFDSLWQSQYEINLVIVGKQGWMVNNLVRKIHKHPQSGKNLFWLDGISDEYLEEVYENSTCLICASEGEGFCLPLIEAAKHCLPIIARDLPVFREIVGNNAYFFSGMQPSILSTALINWMTLYEENKHPRSDAITWLTWKDSANQLMACVLNVEEKHDYKLR